MPPFKRPSLSPVRTAAATALLLAAATLAPLLPSAEAAVPNADPTPAPSVPSTPLAGGAERVRPTFSIRIGSFNILGSTHTRGPGGYAPGTARARGTARLIRDKGIDLIGLQEVEEDQLRVLKRRLGNFRIWPARTFEPENIGLQIAFDQRRFVLVDHGRITTVSSHHQRPLPWVRLRERASGRVVTVMDMHNSPRGQEAERDRATREEIGLIKRLRRSGPVFTTGDMNEHAEWFCKVAGQTDLKAAQGHSSAGPRGCNPPPRRDMRIDWIMGGRTLDFSRYQAEKSQRVTRLSDHAFLSAKVVVGRR